MDTAARATRLPLSIVIYHRHSLILREICHNSESARCVPPVVEAFPHPLGHPVKHRDTHSLSHLGSQHLTLQRGEDVGPWLKTTELNTNLDTVTQQIRGQ